MVTVMVNRDTLSQKKKNYGIINFIKTEYRYKVIKILV